MVFYYSSHDLKFVASSEKDTKTLLCYVTNYIPKSSIYTLNIVSVKSVHAMWKVLMIQNCDNDILEGLAVAETPPQTLNPLFLVGGIGSCRFYFLLNLQLKWNIL